MNRINFQKLEDLCLKITDGSHYSPAGVEFGIPMLSVKDMNYSGFSYSSSKYVSEKDYFDLVRADCKPLLNDILIAKDGSYLKHVFVIKKEINQAILSSIGILRPNLKKINPDYLKYYLQTTSVKNTVSRKYVSGSALPRIILKNFGKISVIYRNILDQQKIAITLSTLDAKIELNNKINSELEKMVKTIYDYWFVQFDFPDDNGKSYKSSGGKMIWSEELKRDVPDGWDIDKLNTRIKIGSGFPFDSDDYNNVGKYKIITIKNVQDNSLETNTADKIDFIPQNLSKFCKLEIGDVLMSLTGNVGRMCFVDEDNLLLNQRVGKILGEKDFIIFGYLYFKRPENQKRLEKISGGSSQANLSPVDAVKDYFAIPPDNILNEFSKIVTPIFNQIINNKKENKKLVELRDWLLPMLMNGQIKVN